MFYRIERHGYDLRVSLDMLPDGPAAIIWENKGSTRIINKEKVINAIDVLEDMSKHKGPDTGEPAVLFFWDDADIILTPLREHRSIQG